MADQILQPPTNIEENLVWRASIREAAARDPGLQRVVHDAAMHDPLFFFSALMWCYEPRARHKIKPFVPWPHQVPAIRKMDESIDLAENTEQPVHVLVDKSRGQGATYIMVYIYLRRWLRDPMFSAGLVTRNEKLVDSRTNADTLLWKFNFGLEMLPPWMLPKGFDFNKHRSLTDHSYYNPALGGTVVGDAATGDIGRGGRRTSFGKDEFAMFNEHKPGADKEAQNAISHNTNHQFTISTYKGTNNEYCRMAQDKDSDVIRIVLDWKDNPTQNKLLYRHDRGKCVAIRTEDIAQVAEYEKQAKAQGVFTRLRRRGYKLEGKGRSPWYDRKCLEASSTPMGIAQELDRDPFGSVSKVFDAALLADVKNTTVRQPTLQGRLVYDTVTAQPLSPYFVESEDGSLKLWHDLGPDSRPPKGRYKIGNDISGGGGGAFTSNSTAVVINQLTGEEMAEFASPNIKREAFAYFVAALGRWYYGAEVCFENNFAGGFTAEFVEIIGYENIFMQDRGIEGYHEKTSKPGFRVNRDEDKQKIFDALQNGMAEKTLIVRSEALIKECGEYEYEAKGKIVHSGSKKSEDPGGRGAPHGDLVIGAGLAWYLCCLEVLFGEMEAPEEDQDDPLARWLKEYDEALGRQVGEDGELSSEKLDRSALTEYQG